jgi:KipI family sensor histidine kinase inhibitor
MNSFLIKNVGDQSVTIYFDNKISPDINLRVHQISQKINDDKESWLIDVVPAYNSLNVIYDLNLIQSKEVKNYLSKIMLSEKTLTKNHQTSKIIKIPVKYGGNEGPDLEYVADFCKLSSEEIIKIHTSEIYLVYMTGFSPGFPYLGKLDPRIHCPRLDNPRVKVDSGSVGLAGSQTGIYSIDSPGGWRIIGRTPIKLFDLEKNDPFYISPGMQINFFSVDFKNYEDIQKRILKGKNFLDIGEEYER